MILEQKAYEIVGKFLKNIDQIFKGSRSSLTPVPELFPPVDLDYLRTEIRIEERAAENAKGELPESKSKTPDAIELDIEGRLQEVMSRYLADYNRQNRLVSTCPEIQNQRICS